MKYMMKMTVSLLCLIMMNARITAEGETDGLRFEQISHDTISSLGDDHAVARFAFRNESEKDVRIVSVTTSCGCTAAVVERGEKAGEPESRKAGDQKAEDAESDSPKGEFEPVIVGPGEEGVIAATFVFGDRVGPQRKKITVVWEELKNHEVTKPASHEGKEDEPDKTKLYTVELRMKVTIPKVIEMLPRMVYWKPNEARTTKIIKIGVATEESIKLVQANSDDKRVAIELKSLDNPRVYELHITPSGEDNGESYRATITLTSDYPEDKPLTFRAYARVMGDPRPRNDAATEANTAESTADTDTSTSAKP